MSSKKGKVTVQKFAPNARILTFGKKKNSLAGWSRETGIPESTIRSRLGAGWGVKESLTTQAMFYKE